MSNAPRQYQVACHIPQEGPRGGQRPPKVEFFLVAAISREDARAAFLEELPDMASFLTSVSGCECRVMRGALGV
jgi:hypothetical protein